MIRTVTHKHLKRQIDILEKTEGIDDLLAELQFSTLLLPVNVENNTLSFPLVQIDDEIYAPVFTDIYEYNKIDLEEDFTLIPNQFDFYMNLLDEKIDGILIDVEGERFPLTKQFKKVIGNGNIFDYDPQVFTLKEIKQIKDSVNNEKLEEFLKDESNWWDYEKIMELLLKSHSLRLFCPKKTCHTKQKTELFHSMMLKCFQQHLQPKQLKAMHWFIQKKMKSYQKIICCTIICSS